MAGFTVEIKAQDSSESTIEKVRTNLTATDAAAAKASQSIDGMRDALGRFTSGQAAAQSTSTWAVQAAQNADALTASYDRQEAALDRLNAPLAQYRSAMQNVDTEIDALDQLMADGRISTKEYADEVSRLNSELAKVKPGGAGAAKPMSSATGLGGAGGAGEDESGLNLGGMMSSLGPAGQMLASFTTGIGGAVAGTIALGMAIIHLGDEYTELTNRVARFADGQHSADDIVSDNLKAAGEVHASLSSTVDLYGKVAEGAQAMNLTEAETINMTKNIAEASQLAGKGMDGAGEAAQRLAYMMESGAVTTRDLRSLFREFPAIADAFTAATGKSRTELMAMATDGRINITQLMGSLTQAGTISGQFASQNETVAAAFGHVKDEVSMTVGKLVDQSGVLDSLKDLIPAVTQAIKDATASLSDMKPVLEFAAAGWKGMGTYAEASLHILHEQFTLGGVLSDGQKTLAESAIAAGQALAMENAAKGTLKMIDFAASISTLRTELDKIDPTKGGVTDFFVKTGDAATAAQGKVATLQTALDLLKNGASGFNPGKLGPEGTSFIDQNAAMGKDLMGQSTAPTSSLPSQQAADAAKKNADEQLQIQRQIDDATMKAQSTTSSYGAVIESASKALIDHNRAVTDVAAGLKYLKSAIEDTHDATAKATIAIEEQALAEKGVQLADEERSKWQAQVAHAVRGVSESMIEGKTSIAQYDAAMSGIDSHAGPFSASFKMLSEMRLPEAEWTHSMTTLQGLFDHGKISAFEFNTELAKLQGDNPGFKALEENIKRDVVQYDLLLAKQKEFDAMRRAGISSPEAAGTSAVSVAAGSGHAIDGSDYDTQLKETAAMSDLAKATKDASNEDKEFWENAKLHQTIMDSAATSSQKYAEEIERINSATTHGIITGDDQAKLLQVAADHFSIARDNGDQYRLAVAKLDDEMKTGLMSQQVYDNQLASITEKFHNHDEAKGMADGIDAITKSMDVAVQTQKTIVDGFNGIESAITDLVVKGTTDWTKLITMMETDMAKLLLDKGLKGIFNFGDDNSGPNSGVGSMLGNAVGIGSSSAKTAASSAAQAASTATAATTLGTGVETGAATGAATISASIEAASASGAAMFAEALASGSATSGAASGLSGLGADLSLGAPAGANSIADLAAAPLPAFATGGEWTVGHGTSSAPDTSLQMFRANVGERVSVSAPGQGAGKGGQAPVTVKPTIVNVNDQKQATLASMNTAEGETLVMNILRKNASVLKGYVNKG